MWNLAPTDPQTWAQQSFGAVELGDQRRTDRVVATAARLAAQPAASLPRQMQDPAALKALYRLLRAARPPAPDPPESAANPLEALDEAAAEAPDGVNFPALMAPHWQQTRQAASEGGVVLLVQDTTELDYTRFRSLDGLGPIGDGRGRGLLLQSVLAVRPNPRQALGLLHAEPFLRRPKPPGETRRQTTQRPRESDVWARSVAAVGPPPPGARWVHVGDAYADLYTFLTATRRTGTDFLVRAAYDRCAETADGTATHSLTFARSLPARGPTRTLPLAAAPKRPARTVVLQLSWAPLTLQPPADGAKDQTAIPLWVVRVWEADPPPSVKEPVEWILLTSLPTETAEDAWARVDWYTGRWLIEEFHHSLKTGCAVEKRRLPGESLVRLLGLLLPLAVRLLQLRDLAQQDPSALAADALPAEEVGLVAHLAHEDPARLTVGRFWRLVAQRGGYQGRRSDGPPGWKALWFGWLEIQTLLQGVRLAAQLPPPKCGYN